MADFNSSTSTYFSVAVGCALALAVSSQVCSTIGAALAQHREESRSTYRRPKRAARSVQRRGTELEMKENAAALKIQAVARGGTTRKRVGRLKSWQAKTLRGLESSTATVLIVLLVVFDMYLTLHSSTSDSTLNTNVSYFLTTFFALELGLRFHCYAYLSRGRGRHHCDLSFFRGDNFRVLDLAIVTLDVLGTVVLLVSTTGAASGVGFLRFVRSGRALRLA